MGINNQNFIMRDEQTGSWWQQVTGRGHPGPAERAAARARCVHDEVSFGIWKAEQPGGRVLKPRADPKRKDDYESADWERRMKQASARSPRCPRDPAHAAHDVVGVA